MQGVGCGFESHILHQFMPLGPSGNGTRLSSEVLRVRIPLEAPTNPSIAQPEERDATNVKVTGSSPVRGSIRKAGDDWLKSSFHSSSCSLAATTGDTGHQFQFLTSIMVMRSTVNGDYSRSSREWGANKKPWTDCLILTHGF